MESTNLDSVERQYYQALTKAEAHGDNDEAYSLSVGLKEYREYYKDGLYDRFLTER